MKSSGSGHKERHQSCLIVDGYNIIAKMQPALFQSMTQLESLRTELVERLTEYAAFSGESVIVVFDAQTKGQRSEQVNGRVTVIYTLLHETADSCIERLVYDLRDRYPQITVATSDSAEQQVIFGGGALRISAAGLLRRLDHAKSQIRRELRTGSSERPQLLDHVRQDVANILEKWRRR